MQREGFFVRAFVKVALPMRAQSVGAFVAEKNSAAQWALGVGVAVTEMEIGTIATRLRRGDFIDAQWSFDGQRAQWVSCARRAERIDAANHERCFKAREIHAMSVLFEAATRA